MEKIVQLISKIVEMFEMFLRPKNLIRYFAKTQSVNAATTATIRFNSQTFDYEIRGIAVKVLDTATLRTLQNSGTSLKLKMGTEDIIDNHIDHSFFSVDGGTFLKEIRPIKVRSGRELEFTVTNNLGAAATIQILLMVEVNYGDYTKQ